MQLARFSKEIHIHIKKHELSLLGCSNLIYLKLNVISVTLFRSVEFLSIEKAAHLHKITANM